MAPSAGSPALASVARRSIAPPMRSTAAATSPRSRAASALRSSASTWSTPGAAAGPSTTFSSPSREKSVASASGKSRRCEWSTMEFS